MRKLIKASLVVLGLSSVALLSGTASAASIVDSKHNLGNIGGNTANRNYTDATQEVCVFCHTPHGGKGATGAAVAPLWNKALPASGTFTTYDTLGTSSLQGSITEVGSVSIACLSCHDGSQAMDVMINQPGSGGYNASGAVLGGTWTSGTGNVGADGKMLTTNPIPGLGTNLKDDHPVGIQYAGGLRTGTDHTDKTAYRNPDFNAATAASINGQSIWYVEVPNTNPLTSLTNKVNDVAISRVAGIRNKTDMALYTRKDAAIDADRAQPFVECASCHDPHQANTDTFLRIDNTGSAVCLACHVK